MDASDRSWSGLEQYLVLLFAEDADELAALEASAGTNLRCRAVGSWPDALRACEGDEPAAIVVAAADADGALARLDEATDVAPALVRVAAVPGDAVADVVAAQNKGLIEHVVTTPPSAGALQWALRTALVRHATAESGKLLVEALRRDRAAARRRVDALESELDQVHQRIAKMSTSDSVTGLYNRRHLMDHWRREVARARRYELPLSIILLEPMGAAGAALTDADLRRVGTFLVQAIRDVDLVARAGDERFGVVLPHCGGADAMALGKRLVDRFGHAPDDLALAAGAAALREDGTDPGEVLTAAEKALTEALSR